MFVFRRLIKPLLITALIGFVIRKLMSANDPRLQRAGQQANRLLGGVVGLDETGNRQSRRRSAAKGAGSALVGGAMSYFFDPAHGTERRARVKRYASEKMRSTERPLLTASNSMTASYPAPQAAAPGITS